MELCKLLLSQVLFLYLHNRIDNHIHLSITHRLIILILLFCFFFTSPLPSLTCGSTLWILNQVRRHHFHNSTVTEALAYLSVPCMYVFLEGYFFSHSSDGNKPYEYACSPRAFWTKACCRVSFPSFALFLALCHCFYSVIHSVRNTQCRTLAFRRESRSLTIFTKNIQCEDESLCDIVQKSEERLKITVCL